MADDLIPVGDEQARAVQELGRFGVTAVQATEKLASYVGRIIGTVPEDAVGLVIGDPLRFVRTFIAAKYDELLSNLLHERQVETVRPVSPSLAIPLLRAAYDESRPQLQEIWAKLLANAMDSKRDSVRLSFINAVKQFDPIDAVVLGKLRDGHPWPPNKRDAYAQMLKVNPTQIEVSFINLEEAKCIWRGSPQDLVNPNLTAFGQELLRALD